tara:strand:- start:1703 stop:1966 length:264 start_codon:yes stop_codon:yes gene_type:complete
MLKTDRIIKAEKRGAPIFSFQYNGKARNVQIGTREAQDHGASWGTPISKSLISHNGNTYVVARDNNDSKVIKRFRVDKIEDRSIQGI